MTGLTAITVGGTVDAVNAELVHGEDIGISEGIPGQRFTLKRGPVVPGDGAPVLEVAGDDGWDEWTHVPDFAASGPDDRHFTLDHTVGRGPLRAGRAPGGRRLPPLRGRPAQGRTPAAPRVSRRRRAARQRGAAGDQQS